MIQFENNDFAIPNYEIMNLGNNPNEWQYPKERDNWRFSVTTTYGTFSQKTKTKQKTPQNLNWIESESI